MEQEIEILIQYEKADFNKRLYLFLEFPDLRRSFQEMDIKHWVGQRASKSLGKQHKMGGWFQLLSFIGRIINIETWYKP
jgi:hypothetical protein